MNRQPYCRPPRSWHPQMTPWWVRASRRYRNRLLRRKQQLVDIDVENPDVLRDAVESGAGVLVTPNHSAHYDAPALYVAADRIGLPLYMMTAWQVFAMSSRFECWAMQRMGCFSIDREGTDRQAFKQAVRILREEPYPLVVFPEGDIYHTTDYVTPFRDGAAAIALSAAKRGERSIVTIPCGIKFWYLEDPTQQLSQALQQIEERLYLRVHADMPLRERIHRLAEAALALKELDYLGQTSSGRLRERIGALLEAVLQQLESRHAIDGNGGTPPERVKALRQHVIGRLEAAGASALSNGDVASLSGDMEDLFFAMQLFSYRGDYLVEDPSIERMAETVDKFEEDILHLDYPNVRGKRRVTIRFGDPVEVPSEKPRPSPGDLTETLQTHVQGLLDGLNSRSSVTARSDTMQPA